ncbi:hypothetical protein PR202_ga14910 [Eleusine coracana subsp. coracana]|uniref:Protein kinase domain-containing protein n=1 Tax=Eleusine coracana subsp. coracana TaxID=191504 RepID=A0AAV5CIL9_ELECO|nr:hypothetical protein PR202_ga14910 [Eleusine coracana subsp. coracana]
MDFLASDIALIVVVLILGYAGAPVVQASGNAACPEACGDLGIQFPFGIGPDCFRDPDFELICNQTRPPKLFLRDGSTEVMYGTFASYMYATQGMGADIVSSLKLQFVRHNSSLKAGADGQPPNRSSLWDSIDVDTDYMMLYWGVVDEPNCAAAKNKANYACVSEHSFCVNDTASSYLCACEDGYFGNPYVSSGCFRDRESTLSLSWDDCLRIAAESAGALYYLHSAASVSVFHRDVKSSNILLDANYTAKVSDFGASRSVSIDQTHVETLVQGTFGYLDPEYYHTGQLNEKSDVYSFGVVLVELLTRREPIFTSDSGLKMNLSSYFLSELKSRPIEEIVAPEIREEATQEDISSVASLAEMCLKLRGEERPTMKQVEMALHTLRAKRPKSCIVAPESDQETQPLLSSRVQVISDQSLPRDMDSYSSQPSQGYYSLGEEFIPSTQLPR